MVTGSDRRVLRGGSWILNVVNASARVRPGYNPRLRDLSLGFRVVASTKSAGVVSQPNSSVLDSGSHVVRGGSWYGDQRPARCAIRSRVVPDHFYTGLGFRVVVR